MSNNDESENYNIYTYVNAASKYVRFFEVNPEPFAMEPEITDTISRRLVKALKLPLARR